MSSRIVLGNVTIDRDRFEVLVGKSRIPVTFVEFEILHVLARNAGKVVPRSRIALAVWKQPAIGEDRRLTVHVSRLRKKLRESDSWRIETVTKRGYVLTPVNGRSAQGARSTQ
jgi:DNA-binding response OmpR family regulator